MVYYVITVNDRGSWYGKPYSDGNTRLRSWYEDSSDHSHFYLITIAPDRYRKDTLSLAKNTEMRRYINCIHLKPVKPLVMEYKHIGNIHTFMYQACEESRSSGRWAHENSVNVYRNGKAFLLCPYTLIWGWRQYEAKYTAAYKAHLLGLPTKLPMEVELSFISWGFRSQITSCISVSDALMFSHAPEDCYSN